MSLMLGTTFPLAAFADPSTVYEKLSRKPWLTGRGVGQGFQHHQWREKSKISQGLPKKRVLGKHWSFHSGFLKANIPGVKCLGLGYCNILPFTMWSTLLLCCFNMCLKVTQCSTASTLESYLVSVIQKHISPLLHISSKKSVSWRSQLEPNCTEEKAWWKEKEQVPSKDSPLGKGLMRLVALGGDRVSP